MDNIIIPIGKCYKINNSPINKNIVNVVTFTENEPTFVNEGLTSETEFNYWEITSDGNVSTNEDTIYNNSTITFMREIEYSVSKVFDEGETDEHTITRKFIVEEYKFIASQLYIKNINFSATINRVSAKQTNETLDNKIVGEKLIDFKIYTDFSEYQNAIQNPTTTKFERGLACIVENDDDTYTIYFAIEKYFTIIYDYINQDKAIYYFNYNNYKVKFLADVLKFEDTNTYSQYRKKNINSNTYTLRNSYTSKNIKITYTYQGNSYIKSVSDWNATQILDEYSNGKIVVTIEMPLIKMYNKKGELVVDKEILKVGQTFEMEYDYKANYNLYSNILNRTFCVISCEYNFNGIGKMIIKGKEM